MSELNLACRGLLRPVPPLPPPLMTSAAAHAGIPASKIQKWDEEYDVVIVGSGFAGMACAESRPRRLKVLIIEKMSVVGNNSAICGATSPAR